MKKIVYIILLGIILTSCQDWLDVRPKTEVLEDEMYGSSDGYKDVLIGCYIRMKSSALYGQALQWDKLEFLAQYWEPSKETTEEAYANYEWEHSGVQDGLAGIYNNLYKLISDVNGILTRIDGDKHLFDLKMYNLIKGEALAIRAYAHFDLQRLYGDAHWKVARVGLIPYVKDQSLEAHPVVAYDEYQRLLMEDIEASIELLADSDDVLNYSIAMLNNPSGHFYKPKDKFYAFRQIRFNYYAVLGLQARVALWYGDKTLALESAKEIMEAKDPNEAPKYRLGLGSDLASDDWNFKIEHLVGLDVYNLGDIASKQFTAETKFKRREFLVKNEIYKKSTTDVRLAYQWRLEKDDKGGTSAFTIKKFKAGNRSVPLIRMAEIYLIAAESADLTEGSKYMQDFAVSRNISIPSFKNEEQRKELILQEYLKEFVGEGQMYYCYKRLNASEITYYKEEVKEHFYQVPLPENAN